MREEILEIIIIIAILIGMFIFEYLLSKSKFEKAKTFLKKIEDAEIEARFGK